jgi:hypothetical protein
MDIDEEKVVNELYLGRISFEEFRSKHPELLTNDYIENEFEKAVNSKDKKVLGYLLSVLYQKGFSPELCPYLSDLMIADWHKEHENIAMVLQFDVKCPNSVDNLIKAMEFKFDYLFDMGDYEPFVTKCMYAIGDLGTDYALKRLNDLVECDDSIISEAAKHQLERLGEDAKQAVLKKEEVESVGSKGLTGFFDATTEEQRHFLEKSMDMKKDSMTREMCEEVDRQVRAKKEKAVGKEK